MLILAVSTSLSPASAAIYDTSTDTFIEKVCTEKKTYSETLMPTVSALFDECSISPSDIELVAVDVGPGSFTGVRIGTASANAFSAALNKEMIAVSSLEALAFPFFSDNDNIVSLLDARNGNGYAAIYLNGEEIIPPCAIVIDEFLSSIEENSLFVGDGAEKHREAIISKVKNARFSDCEQISTSQLAKLAFIKHKNGKSVKEVLPLYLRPSQAERLYGNQ